MRYGLAHVSINEELTGQNLNDRIVDLNNQVNATPSIAISRIICPRKLDENTSYYAFVIPTYETGRLAGLGIDPASVVPAIKAQAPAWHHDNTKPVWPAWPRLSTVNPLALGVFPVYYEWYFRTVPQAILNTWCDK